MTAAAALLVVIPTYNEASTVGRVLTRLLGLPLDLHVLVVDDGSPDGTAEIVRRMAGDGDRVHLLVRPVRAGLGSAIRLGMAWGLRRGYALFASMDGDGSHDPASLLSFVARMGGGRTEGVIGSRYVSGGEIRNWPVIRRLLSASANRLTRVALRAPLHDMTSGFQLYRRSALERATVCRTVHSDGYAFQIEVKQRLLAVGCHLVEVPIVFTDRIGGRSKLTLRHIGEAAWTLLRLGLIGAEASAVLDEAATGDQDRAPAALPTVSVVIPLSPGPAERAAALRRALAQLRYPAERLEVIVAEGRAPAAQRNQAAAMAGGEMLYFLDDDARPDADVLRQMVRHYGDHADVAAVGGPSCSPGDLSAFERSAADAMASAAHGPCRVRYEPVGHVRYASEWELILCNLSVRRAVWQAVGGLHEALFPNEENEWLHRVVARGYRMIYEPSATVFRRPRGSWNAFWRQFVSYGRGRARQIRTEGWRGNRWYALPLACAAGWGVTGLMVPAAAAVALAGYLAWLMAMARRASPGRSVGQVVCCTTLSATMHAGYAVGFLAGWLTRRPSAGSRRRADGVIRLYRIKSFGERWSSDHEGLPPRDATAVAADALEPALTT